MHKNYFSLLFCVLCLSLAKEGMSTVGPYFSAGGTVNWGTGASWKVSSCAGGAGAVPTLTDDVTICTGTVDVNAATCNCKSITVQSGGILNFNTAGVTLNVATFINVQSGGIIEYTVGANTVIVNLSGNLTCTGTGTFSLINGANFGTLNFTGASVVSGAGAISIAAMGVNTGATANAVNVTATALTFSTPFALTLTKGTFKWNNAGSLADSYNVGCANALTIPFGVIVESDLGTMQFCKTGNVTLGGELLMNGGTVNVSAATGAPFDLYFNSGSGTPQLYVNSGTLNVFGGVNDNHLGTQLIDFEMTGGTMNLSLGTLGPGWANFQINNLAGSTTIMSGGLITLQDGSNTSVDLDFGGANVGAMGSAHYNVTGGTIQFGTASTAQSGNDFYVNAYPNNNYPNFVVNGKSAALKAKVTISTTTNFIIQSLVINNANSIFDMLDGAAGTADQMTISGTNGTDAFINNGVAGTPGSLTTTGSFIPRASTVVFAGSTQQTIGGSVTTTFNNLKIANTSGVTSSTGVLQEIATNVNGVMTFTSGAYNLNSTTLNILSSSTGAMTGGSTSSYLISEDQSNGSMASAVQWNVGNSIAGSNFLFPFGYTGSFIPFTFGITTASGDANTTVTLATYESTNGTNLPYPSLAGEVVTSTQGNAANSAGCFPSATNNSNLQVNRYWEITVGATVPTATITFSYLGAENNTLGTCGGGAAGSVSAQRWDVVNGWWGSTIAGVSDDGSVFANSAATYAFGAGVGSVSVANVSVFSPWTLVTTTMPLPVKLVKFNAVLNSRETVDVSWNTASETNNDYFTVERTKNGSDFEFVGRVKGGGNSSEPLSYKLTDMNPLQGVSYYRLLQTDFNGQTTIYDPIPVNLQSAVTFNVFPNPSHGDELYMTLNGEIAGKEILVVLYDLQGQTTYSKVIVTGQDKSVMEAIDPSAKLAAGVYLVVATSDNKIYKQKVIIE
jgi:hypothetical protein